MPDNKHQEFKKITLRFLKEAGLYRPFLNYIMSLNGNNWYDISLYNWFEKKLIDQTLGQTNFTEHLAIKKHFYIKGRLTALFKEYLTKKYPNKFQFAVKKWYVDENTIIDIEKDLIKLKIYEAPRDF